MRRISVSEHCNKEADCADGHGSVTLTSAHRLSSDLLLVPSHVVVPSTEDLLPWPCASVKIGIRT